MALIYLLSMYCDNLVVRHYSHDIQSRRELINYMEKTPRKNDKL